MFDVFYWGTKPNLFAFERPADNLDHAAALSRTTHYWYIYGGNDYTGFDFNYVPVPWESQYTHVWPSQWQRDGGVYLANRNTVQNREWHFKKDQQVQAQAAQIFYMDFLNGTMAQHQFEYLRTKHPDIKKTRYVDNHLTVFRRIMAMATTESVWIVSSVCDYTAFDFTWHPPEEQREMIHCFPSGTQKRGDTFRIHVESFKRQMIELELLDWFRVINYVEGHAVERFSIPVHHYESDNLVEEIKNYQFETPYVLFTNRRDVQYLQTQMESSECLWSPKDRTVSRCSRSGSTAFVPRDVKVDLKSQIYDYPYIKDSVYRFCDPRLDIVYISNGEPDEQRWHDHLVNGTGQLDSYTYENRVQWVRGVNGRTAAYQEAARRCSTPWFFAVFAKLEVVADFDWTWMPDYFQEPKHYIFNSRNPVNGLEYGHMGVVAYNRRLVLENNAPGIDFTLSQPHESVPVLSGVAHFNQDAWMTWRTAFREVVKLKHSMATRPTVETEHRLNTWLTVAQGNFAEYCLAGARDAVEYYDQVAGDYELLKLSFEWAFLKDLYNKKYK
jgi:hypothetical protein